jgi:putative aminopeptidase FrvX
MEMRMSVAQIDNTGTIRVRQIGGACAHDYVWQKQK